jgi:hypothetical protein
MKKRQAAFLGLILLALREFFSVRLLLGRYHFLIQERQRTHVLSPLEAPKTALWHVVNTWGPRDRGGIKEIYW